MKMIRGIKFACVPTHDQDRALKFFTEKLGFRVMTDQPFGKQRWIELGIAGAGFQPLAFWTDDVFATAKTMKSKGVEFALDPKKEPWGTTSIFKDADGNQFVLSSK
jgi:catechol 2,3-dioxygenase-like lactoylglutathione lyase family enzyme